MASNAMARETICALRRKIARIEDTLPERLAPPGEGNGLVLRRGTLATRGGSVFLETGAAGFDAALSGGLPRAALTEIHGAETRDAGAAAGFGLALAACLREQACKGEGAVCWIGTADVFREAGLPHAPGLERLFGLAAEDLLFARAGSLGDALWIAEAAARLEAFSAVILELRGSPARLDLTATRRLHRRAQEAGRPVFLLRAAGAPVPTAAPVRLHVSPAPASARRTLAGPLAGSIGRPAFAVTVGKSRASLPGTFILEWNPDEFVFREIGAARPGALVPASHDRPDLPAKGGAVVALRPTARAPAARDQPPREERPAHRRPRRAG